MNLTALARQVERRQFARLYRLGPKALETACRVDVARRACGWIDVEPANRMDASSESVNHSIVRVVVPPEVQAEIEQRMLRILAAIAGDAA